MTQHGNKVQWFRVRTADSIRNIRRWVGEQGVNMRTPIRMDRNGAPFVMLGIDQRAGTGWGGFEGHSAAVWFADADLAKKGLPEVMAGLAKSITEDQIRAELAAVAPMRR